MLARYEVQRGGAAAERFELLRTQDRIEHRFPERGTTEVWQRDARGELSHWKVFHRELRSVHYNAGDLRTLHIAPSWEQLGTLLEPAARTQLSPAPRRQRVAALGTAVLKGQLAGQAARVLWVEELALFTKLDLRARARRTVVKLVGLERCDDGCQPIDLEEVREIEFADVGDSEHDPFVRRFLALSQGHHQHGPVGH